MIVNAKYRILTKVIIWLLTIGSIVIAFFTIPTALAVIVAIICVLIPMLIDKMVFKYNVMWIYPEMTDVFFRRIGFTWFSEENNKDKPENGLAILFERKYDAKYAYSILKSWNRERYIDNDRNISLNIVDEGKNRYSTFLYPGERKVREIELIAALKANLHNKSEFEIKNKVFIWLQNCADYSKNQEMLNTLEKIQKKGEVLLGTAYVVNNEIRPYAKKYFVLRKIRVVKREDLLESDLEYSYPWNDPNVTSPELVRRASEIRIDAS